MTHCEILGYKIGDQFEVDNMSVFDGRSWLKLGDIVELIADDDTLMPMFKRTSDDKECWCHLDRLKPLEKEMKDTQHITNRIKSAERELAEARKKLEALNKFTKWSPKGGSWCISNAGYVFNSEPTPFHQSNGTEYATKEEAKEAAKKMRFHNRMLKYANEHAPGYKPNWADYNEPKAYVEFHHVGDKWGWDTEHVYERAGSVPMPVPVAKELVKRLNSGEVDFN